MASAEEKRRCRTVPDRFPSANNQHMVLGRKGMTTPVRVQQSIRQLETKGLTHTQIAREPGVSRTTVVKYATRDYSPVPPTGGTASRSLVAGEYARKADEWLEADRRMPRKQRHTARRVHERLVEACGFEGSYSSAQRWVKRWRQRHRDEAEGFSELEWAPGSAQVDFGQALAVIAGVERTVHFLVVSFPYSNMRYVAALPGETAECVCHGLNKVFSHAGMVPRVLVFDNATGVGHRRADRDLALIDFQHIPLSPFEFPFEVLELGIGAELLVELLPADRGRLVQVVDALGQPPVDVNSHRLFQRRDHLEIDRYRIIPQHIHIFGTEPHPIVHYLAFSVREDSGSTSRSGTFRER